MSMKMLLLSLTLLLTVTLVGCQKSNFKEVTSTDGGFSVLMPGTPQQQTQKVSTGGGTVDLHLYTASTPDSAFIVGYGDYDATFMKNVVPSSFLDVIRDGAVQSPTGKLVSEKDITLNGSPGREWQIDMPDGKHVSLSRYYLVGSRLYEEIVVNPKGTPFGSDATKFLDSFKLLAK